MVDLLISDPNPLVHDFKVLTVTPYGPAFRAGITINDRLLAWGVLSDKNEKSVKNEKSDKNEKLDMTKKTTARDVELKVWTAKSYDEVDQVAVDHIITVVVVKNADLPNVVKTLNDGIDLDHPAKSAKQLERLSRMTFQDLYLQANTDPSATVHMPQYAVSSILPILKTVSYAAA